MVKETYPGWPGECGPELFLLASCKAEQLATWVQSSSSGPAQVEDAMVNLDSFCRKVLSILPLTFEDLVKVDKYLVGDDFELAVRDCQVTVGWRHRFLPNFALWVTKAYFELFRCHMSAELFEITTTDIPCSASEENRMRRRFMLLCFPAFRIPKGYAIADRAWIWIIHVQKDQQ